MITINKKIKILAYVLVIFIQLLAVLSYVGITEVYMHTGFYNFGFWFLSLLALYSNVYVVKGYGGLLIALKEKVIKTKED